MFWIEISISLGGNCLPSPTTTTSHHLSAIPCSPFVALPQKPEKTDIVEPVLHLQLNLLALQGWLGRGEAVCHLPWHATHASDNPIRATLLDAFL